MELSTGSEGGTHNSAINGMHLHRKLSPLSQQEIPFLCISLFLWRQNLKKIKFKGFAQIKKKTSKNTKGQRRLCLPNMSLMGYEGRGSSKQFITEGTKAQGSQVAGQGHITSY